jgi:hypothetical protein
MADAFYVLWFLAAAFVAPGAAVIALGVAAFPTRHRWTALATAGGCLLFTLVSVLVVVLAGGFE